MAKAGYREPKKTVEQLRAGELPNPSFIHLLDIPFFSYHARLFLGDVFL